MEFETIQDILEFAISKEQASVQFYKDLASQMSDQATRALFETLVRNEQTHIQVLQLEINKLGYTVKPEEQAPASVYLWEERLELDDEARDMDFVDALVLGIQKERAAFRLYAQILGSTENEQFAKTLMELAEEEMRHVLQLEREYEVVTHRKD
ncbi:MAG: ferritin-like domain-containing protein [Planctomycetota bacterium]|jgi:bacterioferritin (cytochrome b1)